MGFKGMSVSDFIKDENVDKSKFYEEFFKEIEKAKDKNYLIITEKHEKQQKTEKRRLNGLPVSVKDCICVKGMQSAAGSKILEGYKPTFDATSVSRIRKNGGKIFGKTTQDEFGFGTFSVNSGLGGIPKNPHDPSRSCGGSSGGAAGLTAFLDYPHIALAESTGGSISCPSSFCGVVGLTPTYGVVSRYGLIDFCNTFDKIGVISRGVDDAALGLSIIAGHDPKDSTSVDSKVDIFNSINKGVKGLRIGLPKEYFGAADHNISKIVISKVKEFENQGAVLEEVSLPMNVHSVSSYYIIACSEASTNLARYCGMRYGATEPISGFYNEYFSKVRSRYFGEEAKRRIMLGTFARMAGYRDAFYLKALKVRTKIINDFKRAFKKVDVLVAPTMPIVAPKFSDIEKMGPIDHYNMDILTLAPNLAGIPQLSVPCGKLKGMPVGMHILGNHLKEGLILRVGKTAEK